MQKATTSTARASPEVRTLDNWTHKLAERAGHGRQQTKGWLRPAKMCINCGTLVTRMSNRKDRTRPYPEWYKVPGAEGSYRCSNCYRRRNRHLEKMKQAKNNKTKGKQQQQQTKRLNQKGSKQLNTTATATVKPIKTALTENKLTFKAGTKPKAKPKAKTNKQQKKR